MPAIPYLKYENAAAALDWLSTTFGFTEDKRYAHEDGTVFHAEMSTPLGDPVYLAGPGGEYRNPRNSGAVNAMVSVDVADADALHERVTGAGGEVAFPPTNTPQGMRVFKVVDVEGHEWFFNQRLDGTA
ncbi:VOC family protein [Saccharothrix sp. Mg75]|uniref:VOC family protein n=1 Tax=Saccharothrix sp. Mg75 TaxID=3445357 RepID=UPI003EEB32F0